MNDKYVQGELSPEENDTLVSPPEEGADVNVDEISASESNESGNEGKRLNMSADELEELLHKAYLRVKNESVEARIDADCQVAKSPGQRQSAAGELILKGLTGVARAILNPGRRSIWPRRK